FALPTFTSRQIVARSRSRRERGWLLVGLALGHHGPRHPGELVGKRDRRDLGWPAREQRRKPGTVPRPMDFCIADDRQRPSATQAAQVATAFLADAAEPVLAPTRALLWHQPNPG